MNRTGPQCIYLASWGIIVTYSTMRTRTTGPKSRRPKSSPAGAGGKPKTPAANTYTHPDQTSLLRPDVGTQAQFKKKKEPKKYRYDSSISPALDWDGQNPAREQGELLIRQALDAIRSAVPLADASDPKGKAQLQALRQASEAMGNLRRISRPFLNWAGKAERLSFEVPTLPLFVHERLSTKAILETLKGHKRDKQIDMFDLFGDPQHSVVDQLLKAYEHRDRWVNRMILGDSLVVMNSLLQYEGLGGQVQMIYMDPPYGVKFGSNFQPFVRKRDVSHGDDEDMTREPEMVQAYRDTWELGLHSYLTYLRDRLLLCRELLAPSGSIFVQISDENVHHVRGLLDEVFDSDNFVSQIAFSTTTGRGSQLIDNNYDILLWYAKDRQLAKYRQLYQEKGLREKYFAYVETPDGKEINKLTPDQLDGREPVPDGRRFLSDNLTSQGETETGSQPYTYNGITYYCPPGRHWRVTNPGGLDRLAQAGRLFPYGRQLRAKTYLNDFPYSAIGNTWDDVLIGSFVSEKMYVVQTSSRVIERCVLMTTDPGDLVLDPTCGSGTTAYVAEQWGRRWITIDVSRVPLALARQRLLTATYPYYDLKDEGRGPEAGFVYKRRQNSKGEEVGGIVPHITLKSIANNEPPEEEILVDRPEVVSGVVRVTGPFCFESTIPAPVEWEESNEEVGAQKEPGERDSFVARMLEFLRKSPVLRLGGNQTVTLKSIRPPARSLVLSSEGVIANGGDKPVAFVFGPENGAVTEMQVFEAAREARLKGYERLFVIGFAIEAKARTLVEKCAEAAGIPAAYIQASTDLTMGDLLKNMRSSQIFSVCGLPEIDLRIHGSRNGDPLYEVELLGLDVFDPVTMEPDHRKGDDVPAWFLDNDYNDLCFHVSQAFFPRTAAWDSLKRALRGAYEDTVWDHLAGTVSEPFPAGQHGQVAVKVFDDRGNELLVVKKLSEARKSGGKR
jgi:adenine-specific DNA-methyltransferase